MPIQLIADSGATKCEWRLVEKEENKSIFTAGISAYFLTIQQIVELLQQELLPFLGNKEVDEIYFYGTGLGNPNNVRIIIAALKKLFGKAKIKADTDMLAAARALCGNEKGIACILGTGSNSCYYNGKTITKNIPGLGYVLGDEGSGAYLGKKILQYYLYHTFDEDLKALFEVKFGNSVIDILENVYKKPLPNRYLAGFSVFLSENRGHYMIENIVEDGLNDFFFQHLSKYNQSWKYSINFVGGVAYSFKDVLQALCESYKFELGKVLKNPMDELVQFHSSSL